MTAMTGPIIEGQLAGAPPEHRPEPRQLSELRADALDRHAGQWMRWPYSGCASASRARIRMQATTDPDLYEFTHRRADGQWWLYGIRWTARQLHPSTTGNAS